MSYALFTENQTCSYSQQPSVWGEEHEKNREYLASNDRLLIGESATFQCSEAYVGQPAQYTCTV